MEPLTPTGPSPISLWVSGDPAACRDAAVELRRLGPVGRDADRLYDTLTRRGVLGFGGLAAGSFRASCAAAPRTDRVAGDSARMGAGLDRLADDLDSVRDGLWEVADQARAHDLVVTGVPYVDGEIHPPAPDRPARAHAAWAGVCALVAHQRRRETAAQERWLAVLDELAGRPVSPVPGVGPAPPDLTDLDLTGPGPDETGPGPGPGSGPGGEVRPAGAAGSATGGPEANEPGAEPTPRDPRPGPGSAPFVTAVPASGWTVAPGVLGGGSWVRPGWDRPDSTGLPVDSEGPADVGVARSG